MPPAWRDKTTVEPSLTDTKEPPFGRAAFPNRCDLTHLLDRGLPRTLTVPWHRPRLRPFTHVGGTPFDSQGQLSTVVPPPPRNCRLGSDRTLDGVTHLQLRSPQQLLLFLSADTRKRTVLLRVSACVRACAQGAGSFRFLCAVCSVLCRRSLRFVAEKLAQRLGGCWEALLLKTQRHQTSSTGSKLQESYFRDPHLAVLRRHWGPDISHLPLTKGHRRCLKEDKLSHPRVKTLITLQWPPPTNKNKACVTRLNHNCSLLHRCSDTTRLYSNLITWRNLEGFRVWLKD